MNNSNQVNQAESQQLRTFQNVPAQTNEPTQTKNAVSQAPKKTNKRALLLIGLMVMIVLIAGVIATPIVKYIASNQENVQLSTGLDSSDETQTADELQSQETQGSQDNSSQATSSGNSNASQSSEVPQQKELIFFEELGLSLSTPSDWRVETMLDVPNEKMVVLAKNNYLIQIIKDPIFTGGGFGWEYDGLSFEEIRIDKEADLTIHGKPFYRFTQYLTSLPEELQDRSTSSESLNLENIFANSLISGDSAGEEIPTLKIAVNGEEREYMIKYQYNSISDLNSQDPVYSYVSLDSPSHQQMMKEMDQIVESISFK